MIRFVFNKWRVASKESIKARWYGEPDGECFRCAWCGMRFNVGDEYNMVFTNHVDYPSIIYGNPLVCKKCYESNGDELINVLVTRAKTLLNNPKNWWFLKEHIW